MSISSLPVITYLDEFVAYTLVEWILSKEEPPSCYQSATLDDGYTVEKYKIKDFRDVVTQQEKNSYMDNDLYYSDTTRLERYIKDHCSDLSKRFKNLSVKVKEGIITLKFKDANLTLLK